MPSMGGLASPIPGQSCCPVGPTPSSPGICSSESTCNGCGETFCHSQREVWSGLTPGITRQGSLLGLGSHGEYAEDWPDALLSCAWRVPHFAWCLGGHGIACAKSIIPACSQGIFCSGPMLWAATEMERLATLSYLAPARIWPIAGRISDRTAKTLGITTHDTYSALM
ncbi:hypothetical protein BKA56DRAFT_326704 [Ilyonectria sp. MPI-CAGE-AT-0026]|nr:hypothetical protein BKA56DRAFT_326704 [Ilyonectria sp. MPI-CAGE-AT-0026]